MVTDDVAATVTQLSLEETLAELERKRKIDAGMAFFAGVMRWQSGQTIESWGNKLLNALTPYVKGIQAALYLVEKTNTPDGGALQWVAGYAIPLALRKSLAIGEGLVGQSAATRETFHLQHLPIECYTESALAKIIATELLILPLIYNDQVVGVLELAAAESMNPTDVLLVQQLAESIAANLVTVRSQIEISKLLQESQAQAARLMASEEELRQNMEELEATHEEMLRMQAELQKRTENFTKIADSVPGAIYQFRLLPDNTHFFTFISSGCKQLINRSPEEVVFNTNIVVESLKAEDLPRFGEAVMNSAQHMSYLEFEFESRHTKPDGTPIWIKSYSQPEPHPEGGVVWNGILTDITEEIKQRRLINDLYNRHHAIFEQANIGIFLLKDGKVIEANPAGAALFGYASREEIYGKTALELSPVYQPDGDSSAEKLAKLIPRVIAGEKITLEWQYICANGELRMAELRYCAIAQESGENYQLFIIRDIQDEIEIKKTAEQYQLQLQAAVEVAHIAFWEYDIPKQKFIFNVYLLQLLEIATTTFKSNSVEADSFFSTVFNAEDAVLVKNLLHQAITEGVANKKYELKHVFTRKDSTKQHLAVRYQVKKEGNISRIIGSFQKMESEL
jgi:PAS domain S-box-containing protein